MAMKILLNTIGTIFMLILMVLNFKDGHYVYGIFLAFCFVAFLYNLFIDKYSKSVK